MYILFCSIDSTTALARALTALQFSFMLIQLSFYPTHTQNKHYYYIAYVVISTHANVIHCSRYSTIHRERRGSAQQWTFHSLHNGYTLLNMACCLLMSIPTCTNNDHVYYSNAAAHQLCTWMEMLQIVLKIFLLSQHCWMTRMNPCTWRVLTASTECNEHRTLHINGKLVLTTKTSTEQERKRKADTKTIQNCKC